MKIQWYPGHMVKTKREIQESLKLIDVIIELVDARIPLSSKNPDIDSLINNKPKIILLNKCELAEENVNDMWSAKYKKEGYGSLSIDSMSGKNFNKIQVILKETVKEKFERMSAKGIIGRPIRAMVVGIPNVGKSSFINKIASRQSAKTGDKPGVTRSRQWIKASKELELLDTPGILWPKFDDENVALHLAYTRAIKDEIIDTEELALKFLEEMATLKPETLTARYSIDTDKTPLDLMEDIGRRRGCVISGGQIDYLRTSNIILDDYRNGKLGKISIERP